MARTPRQVFQIFSMPAPADKPFGRPIDYEGDKHFVELAVARIRSGTYTGFEQAAYRIAHEAVSDGDDAEKMRQRLRWKIKKQIQLAT
jgi:hypothetical protein